MRTRHAAIVVSVASLALPLLVAAPAAASSSGFGHVHAAKARGTTVTPFESPTVAPSGHVPLAARLAAPGGTPSRATGTLGSRSSDPRIQTPTNTNNREQIFKAFPAYTHADAPGGDPPDVSVATNGTQILQVNNFLLRVFSRAGTKQIDVDTPTFFGQDSTFTVADPQVVYDAATGRWFLSAVEFNSGATGGRVLLLVSSVSTLTNSTTWKRYVVVDNGSVLPDQPKIGLTSDKVLLAWEGFSGGSTFSGPEAFVVDKAEAVNFAAAVDTTSSSGGTNDFGLAPANNLSAGATGYFVETGNPGSVLMTVLQVTGRPGDGSTFISPAQQTMNLATASPPAADSGLSAGRIQTGDTRIQNAVWRNGVLSFVAGQGCLPFGSSGSTPVSCIRLWRVNTPSLAIAEDSTYSLNGGFVYTPAITYSTNGDLHLVATLSVASFLAPSMFTVGRPAGSGVWGAFTLVTEEVNFDYTGIEGSPPYRWGDFASAVPDPNNPSDAIVASESTDGSTGVAPNFKVVVAHVGMALSALTLTRSAAAITYGGSVTIVGKLTRPGGQAVVGESVHLWRQLAPASSLSDYKSALTSAAGTVTFVDKPAANAHYQLQYPAVGTGDGVDTFTETTLGNATAVVAEPVMVKITATANHTSIVHGHTVTLTFVVAPNEHGQTFYLQRYYSGAWHTVTHQPLNASSATAFVQTLAAIGTYKYRGYFAGNSLNAAGTSATLTVKAT